MAKKRTIQLTIADYTFSLKNLKVHDDLSEETTCFTADLVCNGEIIAHCKNDGHGGETMVSRPISSMPSFKVYNEAMQAIRAVRDIDYEKEMVDYMKKYNSNCDAWIQYYTPEHLADRLMYKQAAWDDAVKQLKKFAKKFPKAYIWCDGSTMKALPDAEDEELQAQGFENVTEWVR